MKLVKSHPHVVWPLFVVAIFGVSLFFMGVLLTLAMGDPNLGAEPDYYEKAMSWDERQAQRARSEALGWEATAVAGEADAIAISLVDASGAPVGERLSATLFHNADRADAVEFEVAPESPGVFRLPLDAPARGWWTVHVEANEGPERFVQDLRIWVGRE